MDWREYFRNHDEDTEELYQAFAARYDAELHGEVLEYTPEELADKLERDADADNLCNYEKNRFYRKRYAEKMGYKFNDYPYDPKRKYK